MADDSSLEKTFQQKELDTIKEIARDLEKQVQRETKLWERFKWRGNSLPPFNIEPQPHERERLGGGGMTDADRLLRKQWTEDQRLAPHEPVDIPDLRPRNPIRKLFSIPMEGLERVLKPVLNPLFGSGAASNVRFWGGKFGGTMLVIWGIWYNFKYQPLVWETVSGWHIIGMKRAVLPGDPGWTEEDKHMAKDDFYDLKFKSRSSMKDVSETSFTRPAYHPPVSPMIFGKKYFRVDQGGDEESSE